MEILFENEYGEDSNLNSSNFTQSLINVIRGEEIPCESVTIIWVDDEELRHMHIQFLDDPTYTDVMTFNMGDDEHVEAELYISVDRAKDHSEKFSDCRKRTMSASDTRNVASCRL